MSVARKSQLEVERMMPCNPDAERAVLGAMLLNADAIQAAIDTLGIDGSMFYVAAHSAIYEAMMGLHAAGASIDEITLMNWLERAGRLDEVGGVSYLAGLTSAVPTSANIEHYARITSEASQLRRIITFGMGMAKRAYSLPDDDRESFISACQSEFFGIFERMRKSPVQHLEVGAAKSLAKARAICSGEYKGEIRTGFESLDNVIFGLPPEGFVVIGAMPNTGKTAFALQIAHTVSATMPVVFFSLETRAEMLADRLMAMAGGVNWRNLRKGFFPGTELQKAEEITSSFSERNLWIDDSSSTFLDIRSRALQHVRRHGPAVLFIDYAQRMRLGVPIKFSDSSIRIEMVEISRRLADLAKELHSPVVLLSQLNREADGVLNGYDLVAKLKESGQFEADADTVLILNAFGDEESGNSEKADRMRKWSGKSWTFEKLVQVTIAKQRNERKGQVYLEFNRQMQRFQSLGADMQPLPGHSEKTAPEREPEQSKFPEADEDDTPF